MSIKLVALDVDGTLLTDKREIQKETIAEIERIKNLGIKVVITTGRPLVSTQPLLKKFGLDGKDSQYVITLHGAMVETTKGGIITDTPIAFEKIQNVINFITPYQNIDFMIQTKDQIFVLKQDLNWYTSFESYKNHLPIHFRKVEELKDEGLSFYKLMFSGDSEKLDTLMPRIPDSILNSLDTMRSETCYIDMVNQNVNKGIALSSLAEQLKIQPDEVMAIGDGNSDISMIKYAGIGVAMKNATSELLKNADFVTEDNNHAGVAQAINKFC